MKLTDTAETVLQRRYYLEGEDWEALCLRVANAVAQAEKEENRLYYSQKFFEVIHDLDFLPNSPCLMNAGTELGQLSACFVLPVEDTLDGIFTAVRNGALVNKTGGGTGYSFSRLRPKDAAVCSTNGVASGPLSFAEVFDKATDVIKQGGRRRGANMGVLRCDHPNILEFIDAKRDKTRLTNFNLSVALTDEFMYAVEQGKTEFPLINPRNGETAGVVNPVEVFDRIVDAAWDNGEPGVLFISAANKANPTPWLGEFEATNPCGEQWLLPYESCNLGSINLGNFVEEGKIDWFRLKYVVKVATRFLDDVVDCNMFPLPEIEEATKMTRKIGLGIMGLHDMLIQCKTPYASEGGRNLASEVMKFISYWAGEYSEKLAENRGCYPGYSAYLASHQPRRNASLTSIQPTGTVSMIADCSSGCEPYFSIAMVKHVMDGDNLLMVNRLFEKIARQEGFYSEELMREVAETGSVAGNAKVPPEWREIFATAMDIAPEDHIEMQAALQRYVCSSISKTINMPASATKEDVKNAYLMGWRRGCKGLTVYRDGCREGQVLNVGSTLKNLVAPGSAPVEKAALPDVVDAKRFRLKDADGNSVYLIVCFDGDRPVEVFAKFPYDNRVDAKDKSTQWTVTCRMVSMALRFGIPVEEIIKQLDRASGHMHDLPAHLCKLLKSFMAEATPGYATPCPECGGRLVFKEGCETCEDCGHSKCG